MRFDPLRDFFYEIFCVLLLNFCLRFPCEIVCFFLHNFLKRCPHAICRVLLHTFLMRYPAESSCFFGALRDLLMRFHAFWPL
jgi:hypothetical protein